MDVRLKVVSGSNDGQEVAVPGPKFFVGRAEDCHLRPKSEMVSRHHCAIIIDGGTVVLRDFGSKNGSYVNGERVGAETVLSPGDELSVGPLRFEVVIEHQVGGKKKPKVKDLQEAAMRTAEGGADIDDVSQWLMDDDGDVHSDTIHSGDMSDTNATLHSDETGVMNTPDLDAAVEEDMASGGANAAEDTPKEDKSTKKKSGWLAKLRGDKAEKGKLPQQKGPSAADTTEAAVDMLRKMTKK